MKLSFIGAIAAITTALAPVAALAEYPERDVRMVVPWGAGGGTDGIVRKVTTLAEEPRLPNLRADGRHSDPQVHRGRAPEFRREPCLSSRPDRTKAQPEHSIPTVSKSAQLWS